MIYVRKNESVCFFTTHLCGGKPTTFAVLREDSNEENPPKKGSSVYFLRQKRRNEVLLFRSRMLLVGLDLLVEPELLELGHV